MNIVDRLAEQHIQEALDNGEFDDLPGAGKPLELDDDSLVPEELRAAYRLLKNSGFLPPELELRKAIRAAEDLLVTVEDAAERSRAQARLDWLRIQLDGARRNDARGGRGTGLRVAEYQQQLLERMNR